MAGRWVVLAVRVLFGGMFVVAGAMKIFAFPGAPPDLPPDAAAYLGGLAAAGYFMPLLGGVELVGGLAVVAGRFVPLALVVLAPVVVHVTLFHMFLAPGLAVSAFLVASEAYLAWVHRDAFAPLLIARGEAPAAVVARARVDLAA